MPSTHKNIEKFLLREAFSGKATILPEEVRLRKKEAFSDGVMQKEQSWKDIAQKRYDTLYTEEKFSEDGHLPPTSKEALHYRRIFCSYYNQCDKTIPYYWLPKWSGDIKDPSAKVLSVY